MSPPDFRSITNLLIAKHGDALRDTAARQALVFGAMTIHRRSLEHDRDEGRRVVGFLSIADDVSPELAREVIESVQVRGIFGRAPRSRKRSRIAPRRSSP